MSSYLVTGGSSGIGFAIAERLGRDGHTVAIVGRNEQRLTTAVRGLRDLGIACTGAALDVRDAAAVANFVDGVASIDGLVNSAAGNFVAPALDMSPRGFASVVEISLHGSFFCSQAVAKRLVREGRPGAIVSLVATYAWTGAPGVAHSAAAKAGVIAFTKSVAREWGPHGIRVNALAPGFVPTPNAVANILDDGPARQRMLELIPLGRFATPEEIADAAEFLLTTPYVTGTVLTVDGGRSLGIGMHAHRG